LKDLSSIVPTSVIRASSKPSGLGLGGGVLGGALLGGALLGGGLAGVGVFPPQAARANTIVRISAIARNLFICFSS